MMKSFQVLTIIVSVLLAALVLSSQVQSQPKMLRISPYATVSQTIGATEVTVTYHRPGVKGREIWGKLVPYDQVWRAGANDATTFTFSDDVTIGGKLLKAGTYSFFLKPTQNEWTVIFNSDAKQWGAYNYDSTKNVLTFTVKPEPAPFEEWLSYSFTELSIYSAKVSLRWEKLSIPFTIAVDTDAKLATLDKSVVTSAWQQLAAYARYALDTKTNWEKGLEAAERSISINANASNIALKAQLLALGGKYTDAVKAAELAIKVGKETNPKMNTTNLEKMIEEWKKK